MSTLISKFYHAPIFLCGAVLLAAVACAGSAFCGEIHDAARNGDLDKVKALLKDDPALVNSKDTNGDTPLHLAASNGQKDVAEILLFGKAEVNAKDNFGYTPLIYAAFKDSNDIISLLLANSAEINAKDNTGKTALDAAATMGYKDIAKQLLANKADVNSKSNDGHTALHWAARYGKIDVAQLLIFYKADINSKTRVGATPLHIAAFEGFKNVTELLLANGADVNAKAEDGTTPLYYAVQKGFTDVAEILRQHGGQVIAVAQHASADATGSNNISDVSSQYRSVGDNSVEIILVQEHIQGDKLVGILDAVVELKGNITFNSNYILSGVNGLRRLRWAIREGQWGGWSNIIKSELVDGKAVVTTEDGNIYTIWGFSGNAFKGYIIKNGSEEWKLFQSWPVGWNRL